MIYSVSSSRAVFRCSSAQQFISRKAQRGLLLRRRPSSVVRAHKVEITFEGVKHTLEISEGESILEVGRDAGLELPCDCMMGVCMTCPAKLVSIPK